MKRISEKSKKGMRPATRPTVSLNGHVSGRAHPASGEQDDAKAMSASQNSGTRQSATKPAKLRGCPNQKADKMAVCEPWAFRPEIPDAAKVNKSAFKKWSAETSTEHLFYSAWEGINPDYRVTKATNPATKLHGVIADYDATISIDLLQSQCDEWSGDNQPNWVSRTSSDGARLVWLFEEPIRIDQPDLIKPFLKLLAEELKVKNFLPGWDEPAWNQPAQIYEVGRDWRQLAQSPLPTNRLFDIFVRASTKVRWDLQGIEIPLEIIAEEVERKYPDRWEGPFEEGRRGVAFFDPAASNPTAAVVASTGMICFSQEKTFYTWANIFGPEFVRRFQEDRIGAAASQAWYDGQKYWLKSGAGIWEDRTKDDFVLWLKAKRGLSPTRDARETCSEIDRVLLFVQEQRRVHGAIPSIYNPEDIVTINGRRFVNSAAVRVVQPSDTAKKWGEDFPYIANFLDTCWEETLVPCVEENKPPQLAKDIYLAWHRRCYVSALQGDLQKGHALFLVGTVGAGKTLLATRVIADSMGGGSEAADFLLSSSHFNKELAHVGVWNIDDGSANCDAQSLRKFAELVKRTVANPNMSYHAKHQDQQRLIWNGRIVVTLNTDPKSLGIIPNIDDGLQDKMIVLRFSERERTFPPRAELEATIRAELPCYLRWLLDWQVPSDLAGASRFGINAYIHEETRAAALHSGGVRDLLEMVEIWKQLGFPEEDHGDFWNGTASGWLVAVSGVNALKPLVSKYTAGGLGRKFTDASKIRGSGIEVIPSSYKGNGNRYRISLKPSPDSPKEKRKARRFTV